MDEIANEMQNISIAEGRGEGGCRRGWEREWAWGEEKEEEEEEKENEEQLD